MALTTQQEANLAFKKLATGKSTSNVLKQFYEELVDSTTQVFAQQVYAQSALIPTTNPLPSISSIDGQQHSVSGSPIVELLKDRSLVAIPNSTAFYDPSSEVQDLIPYNFGDGSYLYELKRADNSPLYLGEGNWYLDPASGVLTFFSGYPTGVSAAAPPKVTVWKYVGAKGLSDTSVPTINRSVRVASVTDLGASFVPSPISASGFFLIDAAGFTAGDTFNINGTTFELGVDFAAGATDADTADNLVTAVAGSVIAGLITVVNQYTPSTDGAGSLLVFATSTGDGGNAITLAVDAGVHTTSGATLTGGQSTNPTAILELVGNASGGQDLLIDTVTLALNEKVLLRAESDATRNGAYQIIEVNFQPQTGNNLFVLGAIPGVTNEQGQHVYSMEGTTYPLTPWLCEQNPSSERTYHNLTEQALLTAANPSVVVETATREVRAGRPVAQQVTLAVNVTTDQTYTGITLTHDQVGVVDVYVYGIRQRLAYDATSGDCYLADPTETLIRPLGGGLAGDHLMFNPSVAGFNLSSGDPVTLRYTTTAASI